ncbi:hypothetical protein PENSPDRAFT_15623 [Peniophora sp. CONT]|nr:hypothetical protein PENSPDRAFT_15623 [Peniophora sp. CONT]
MDWVEHTGPTPDWLLELQRAYGESPGPSSPNDASSRSPTPDPAPQLAPSEPGSGAFDGAVVFASQASLWENDEGDGDEVGEKGEEVEEVEDDDGAYEGSQEEIAGEEEDEKEGDGLTGAAAREDCEEELDAATETLGDAIELESADGRLALFESLLSQLSTTGLEAQLEASSGVIHKIATEYFELPDIPIWRALWGNLAAGLPKVFDDTVHPPHATLVVDWCRLVLSGEGLRDADTLLKTIKGSRRITGPGDCKQELPNAPGGWYVHFVHAKKEYVEPLKTVLRSRPNTRVSFLLALLDAVPIIDGVATMVYWGVWTSGSKGDKTAWTRWTDKNKNDPNTWIEELVSAIERTPTLKDGCWIDICSVAALDTAARIMEAETDVDMIAGLATLESLLMLLTPEDIGLVNQLLGKANIISAVSQSDRGTLQRAFQVAHGCRAARAKLLTRHLEDRLQAIALELPTTTVELLRLDRFLQLAGLNGLMLVPYHPFGHTGRRLPRGTVRIASILPIFDPATTVLESPESWPCIRIKLLTPLPTTVNHALIRIALYWKAPYPAGVVERPRAFFELIDAENATAAPIYRKKIRADDTSILLDKGIFPLGVALGMYTQADLDDFLRALRPEFYRCDYKDCKKVYWDQVNFAQHRTTDHPDVRTCNLCKLSFPRVDTLKQHMKDAVCVDKDGNPTDNLVCGEEGCALRFPHLFALTKHKRDEHNIGGPQAKGLSRRKWKESDGAGYPCDDCDAPFATESLLEDHQNLNICVQNGKKCPPPKCPYDCPFHYDIVGDRGKPSPYSVHISTFHGGVASVCPKCYSQFSMMKIAVAHMDDCVGHIPADRCDKCHLVVKNLHTPHVQEDHYSKKCKGRPGQGFRITRYVYGHLLMAM